MLRAYRMLRCCFNPMVRPFHVVFRTIEMCFVGVTLSTALQKYPQPTWLKVLIVVVTPLCMYLGLVIGAYALYQVDQTTNEFVAVIGFGVVSILELLNVSVRKLSGGARAKARKKRKVLKGGPFGLGSCMNAPDSVFCARHACSAIVAVRWQSALLYLAVIELIPEIFEIGEDAGLSGSKVASVSTAVVFVGFAIILILEGALDEENAEA